MSKSCATCRYEWYSPMTNCYLQEDNNTYCSVNGAPYEVVSYDYVCDLWENYI